LPCKRATLRKSFNPRLTSAARRTIAIPIEFYNSLKFQSAPHFGSEANHYIYSKVHHFSSVSIRASLRQRGEPSTSSPSKSPSSRFQSAPHFGSEANPSITSPLIGMSSFQSAPHFGSEANPGRNCRDHKAGRCFNPRLTSAARRTPTLTAIYGGTKVSIRASLRQRGEPFMRTRPSSLSASFNPRLTSAARRTSVLQ